MTNKVDNTAILLIHCPDKPGILASVTEFINTNKGNILYLDQWVNNEENIFFMRIEWDLTCFIIPREKIYDYFGALFAVRFTAYSSGEALQYLKEKGKCAFFVIFF